MEFVETSALSPQEECDADHADALCDAVVRSRFWAALLLVEAGAMALLDGHYRRAVAPRLGLVRIPAVRLGYDDPRLALRAWRPDRQYAPEDVLRAAETEDMFPINSTRHTLSVPLPKLSVPLDALRLAEPG